MMGPYGSRAFNMGLGLTTILTKYKSNPLQSDNRDQGEIRNDWIRMLCRMGTMGWKAGFTAWTVFYFMSDTSNIQNLFVSCTSWFFQLVCLSCFSLRSAMNSQGQWWQAQSCCIIRPAQVPWYLSWGYHLQKWRAEQRNVDQHTLNGDYRFLCGSQ